MRTYQIKDYDDYELHYSNEVQLVYNRKFKRYLKLNKRKDGYLQVSLSKNGKTKTFTFHQLVWMTLKGDIPKGFQINHIDEVKTNNSIENLELVTPKENCNHGTRNTRVAKAQTNRQDQSKPIVGIKKDLSEILQYPSGHEASRDRGFNYQNISQCCLNKRKTHQGYIWFFKDDFEQYLTKFNNDIKKIIDYKKKLINVK